jgi:hypothetical protein
MGITIMPGNEGGYGFPFVLYSRHKDDNERAHTAVHELTHGFWQKQSNYYEFGEGYSPKEDTSPNGHDSHKGWDLKDVCIMHWQNAGLKFCLKHLEAFRRQRYGFFSYWRQEKDKR